jgi:hypothetical protein
MKIDGPDIALDGNLPPATDSLVARVIRAPAVRRVENRASGSKEAGGAKIVPCHDEALVRDTGLTMGRAGNSTSG